MIDIRLVTARDISLLEEHMPPDPTKHIRRLMRQEKNEIAYLIAFREKKPVGHVVIQWAGTTDEPMASQLTDCPDIVDLRVHHDFYRRGIGSKLMDEAENMVRSRGFKRVGLSVGTDNVPAAQMYKKRGYNDAGFGRHIERGSYTDKNGNVNSWEEECIYLIKDLS